MNNTIKKMLSALLSLCLGWSILCLAPVTASADDIVIEKVLATAQPGPVVLMEISTVAVATSTEGCTVGSVTWYDMDGQPASGSFEDQNYRLEIRIDAGEGYVFAGELRAYLNNSGVDAVQDESGKSVTLVREITPAIWAPTVIKHPGGETVTEDDWASFVATAIYAESCSWILVSPDGSTVVDCAEIGGSFPGSSANDNGQGKIILHNIPLEMNGWQIKAVFEGPGGKKTSNGAAIRVNPDPDKATPTPARTHARTHAHPCRAGGERRARRAPACVRHRLGEQRGLPLACLLLRRGGRQGPAQLPVEREPRRH